jgi:hypothetical protein
LNTANPHLRPVIVAALSTGCRMGELLGLRWNSRRRSWKLRSRLPALGEAVGKIVKRWLLACANFLGHAITTATRYLQSSALGLEKALEQLESGEMRTKGGQDKEVATGAGAADAADGAGNALAGQRLDVGGPPGDRTQDTVIKSHVLYH